MPWRVPPAIGLAGKRPDPYRVWLSEVMLQQTTVAAVRDYFERFTHRWPDVQALASAEDADVMAEWAGLGYYARARNLLKCARVVTHDHNGRFPESYAALLTLPGIGPYTAAAISAIAFDLPETVVDGNVERVMARVFEVHTPLPTAKPELTEHAASLTPRKRPGDYAQAVMDLGATICTPKNPNCPLCPWQQQCLGFARKTAPGLPRKLAKKPKPTRHGIAYVLRRSDGALLLETRPDKGLLGGMLGWPTSDWTETPTEAPPIAADWKSLDTQALHTFTHFHLKLTVKIATVSGENLPDVGQFIPQAKFRAADLPTVMRKVFDLAEDAFGET